MSSPISSPASPEYISSINNSNSNNNSGPSKIDESVASNVHQLEVWRQRRKLMMSTLELTSKQLDELNLELESTWKCVSLSAHTDTDTDTNTRAHPSMFDTPMKNDQK